MVGSGEEVDDLEDLEDLETSTGSPNLPPEGLVFVATSSPRVFLKLRPIAGKLAGSCIVSLPLAIRRDEPSSRLLCVTVGIETMDWWKLVKKQSNRI